MAPPTPQQIVAAIDEKWDSPASRAYIGGFERQRVAIEGIKELTDVLDTNLTKVGWAIVALWASLGVAVASFVVELSTEAAATVAPAAPAAAPAAAASTAKVVGLVTVTVGLYLAYVNMVVDSLVAMRQRRRHPSFPAGSGLNR